MLLVPGCIQPETASTFLNQQLDIRSCVNPDRTPGALRRRFAPRASAARRRGARPCSRRRDAVSDFRHGLSDRTVAALNRFYDAPGSWWRALADDPGLVVAIRDEYLNVYYKGQ